MEGGLEFTCAECGGSAYFHVSGDFPVKFHTETLIPPDLPARCKAAESSPAPMQTNGFQCPHLEAALHRALEAKTG